MKLPAFVALCTVIVLCAGAVENIVGPDGKTMVKLGDKYVPVENIRSAIHRANLAKTGGIARKDGSARGVFLLLDAQEKIKEEAILPAMETIDRKAKVLVAMKKCSGDARRDIKRAIIENGGATGVLLVDAADGEALVVAPENGWAMVNVAALSNGAEDGGLLAARVRKEILRAFAFLVGGAYMTRADPLMRDVREPSDLDRLREDMGIEILQRIEERSSFYGITPWHQSTYRQACLEGWANSPTNDYQKAIWEEVNSAKEQGPANRKAIRK